MSFELLSSKLILQRDSINIQTSLYGVMESRRITSTTTLLRRTESAQAMNKKIKALPYFGTESFVVLLCLTISLLILPLILPPLPPPPVLLLLLPIVILVVLVILAFTPSNLKHNIASL